jgi:hypothetical protein
MWIPSILAAIWASIVLGVSVRVDGFFSAPTFTTEYGDVAFPVENSIQPTVNIQHIWALLIVAVLQAVVPLSVHCVELLANRSREETLWRKAAFYSSSPSSNRSSNNNKWKGSPLQTSSLKKVTHKLANFNSLGLQTCHPLDV